MIKTISIVLVLALAVTSLAQGITITVGPGASYDFQTIQEGIDAAVDEDTVLVAPGEYVISEPITFRGKAITVQSEGGPDETTIRMGTPADANRGSVVIFEDNETNASVLNGFTITGGRGSHRSDPYGNRWSGLAGGGILCWEASPTIFACTINKNTAPRIGGVMCLNSHAILIDCMITENEATVDSGGVASASGSSLILTNCAIRDNSAYGSGGGLLCWDNAAVAMTDCIVMGNSTTGTTIHGAGYGSGLSCLDNSSLTLTNCNISENRAGSGGGGIHCNQSSVIAANCVISENSTGIIGGAVFCEQGSVTMTDCIVSRNSAGTWGGGIECYLNASLNMIRCEVIRNTSQRQGGGVECTDRSSMTLTNCQIIRNSAAAWGGGLSCDTTASATVINSILWENTASTGYEISLANGSTFGITYCNVAGGRTGISVEGGSTLKWGVGNIDANPYFADPDNDKYYLKSEAGRWDPNSQSWVQDAVTSPCIDAGDPNSDWRPELWPHGMRANMGAYGGTAQASRSLSDTGSIADVNRDGIVDPVDIRMMVDHWHLYEPYCDISPTPFGDGIVDAQDLVILAEHLFEDVSDPTLVAHWPLDEAQGIIAYDNVTDCNGTLIGGPIWQPDGGMVAGALQFDGIDDYVSTDSILNPADCPFSIFAWVTGGAPGQAIVSQQGVANWLAADTKGNLMTELKATGRSVGHLYSETVITDGQWHRIGLVWDGSHRTLCVDGIVVAEDTQHGLIGSEMGLYIGAGQALDSDTFFSGLIDDLRVYNRVVSP